jgi:hypothetical protein
VGRRLFALTADPPLLGSDGAPGGDRLAGPWSPLGWARFVAAARAAPSTPAEALALAWLVYASVHTGQGLVTDPAAPDLAVVDGQRDALAAAVRAAAAPVRSSAAPSAGGGFDVVLWTSRHVWFPELRIRPMGATSGERLRRATVRVDRRGAVTFLSDVAL